MRPPQTNNAVSFNLSLYSTLTTTQTAAATAQHKVKQQLTERAYIVSYWLGYLKPSHSPVGGAA